jgi:hypothetical protein
MDLPGSKAQFTGRINHRAIIANIIPSIISWPGGRNRDAFSITDY